MIDEILCSHALDRTRIALRERGRLMELVVEEEPAPGAVGDIVLGRVATVVKGMDAAFVDIGAPRAGFLSLVRRPGPGSGDAAESGAAAETDGAAPGPEETPLHEGAAVLVQVARAAQADKGPGLTRNVTLPGRYLVLTPFRPGLRLSRRIADPDARAALEAALAEIAAPDEGFIARTAAEGVPADALAADAAGLRARWAAISARRAGATPPASLHAERSGLETVLRDRAHEGIRRILAEARASADAARAFAAAHLPALAGRIEHWSGPAPLFEALGVEDGIAAALEPEVPLPCGGTVVIETTRALTAVDVNTARNTGRGGHAETVLETNLEAAAEIARQLRLRNAGGLICVDFVHMDDAAARERVHAALMAGLAEDPGFIRATGFSELGLVEIARRRGRGPLAGQLAAARP